MTVGELREELEKYPDDLDIECYIPEYIWGFPIKLEKDERAVTLVCQ